MFFGRRRAGAAEAVVTAVQHATPVAPGPAEVPGGDARGHAPSFVGAPGVGAVGRPLMEPFGSPSIFEDVVEVGFDGSSGGAAGGLVGGRTGALVGGPANEPMRALASVRSLVAAEQKALRKRFIVDHALDGYHRALARLAEEVIVGLLDRMLLPAAMNGTEHTPVRVLATGGLARQALAPGAAIELLVLLPEAATARQPVDTIANRVAAALRAVELPAQVRTETVADLAGAHVDGARDLWTGCVPLTVD